MKKIDEKITSVLIRLRFFKKDSPLLLKRVTLAWLIFLLFTMVSGLVDVSVSWQKAVGFEYLWIAENIEKGNGFSFSDCNGSFRPVEGCNEYFPTTYEEPAYPYLLALTSKIFGKYGRLVILIFQTIAIFFTSIFIYHLSLNVFNNPATGILAGLLLPLLPNTGLIRNFLSPVAFAGLIIVVLTYLILRCLDKPSIRRGIILGLILGCASLLFAPVQIFILISVFLLLITKNPNRSIALKTATALFFTTIIVMSGWTIRNYLVSGQIIPVRTGFGLNLYYGNTTLAESFTLRSGAISKGSGLQWKARKPIEAVILSYDFKKQSAIYRRSRETLEQDVQGGYWRKDALRDKVAFKKALQFIVSNPRIFLSLTYYKMLGFFFFFGWKIGIVSLLFLVSIIEILNNTRVRVLVLLILAYASPYFLTMAWFYRYRYPIEPLILVLACYIPVLFFSELYAQYIEKHSV